MTTSAGQETAVKYCMRHGSASTIGIAMDQKRSGAKETLLSPGNFLPCNFFLPLRSGGKNCAGGAARRPKAVVCERARLPAGAVMRRRNSLSKPRTNRSQLGIRRSSDSQAR
jgi:hypothetical protein